MNKTDVTETKLYIMWERTRQNPEEAPLSEQMSQTDRD